MWRSSIELAPCLLAILSGPSSSLAPDTKDPDHLYARRDHLPNALEAAELWSERLTAGTGDFEAAWKLARASYWLGSHLPVGARRDRYERGVDAARLAVALEAHRPEGHFWMAANMGALAESYGLGAGLKYRGANQEGAPDRSPHRPRVSARSGRPRAGTMVSEGAGTLRRQHEEIRRAPETLPRVRPGKRGLALLPGGDVPSHESPRGGATRAREGARLPARCRLGPRNQGVPAESEEAPR